MLKFPSRSDGLTSFRMNCLAERRTIRAAVNAPISTIRELADMADIKRVIGPHAIDRNSAFREFDAIAAHHAGCARRRLPMAFQPDGAVRAK